MEVLVVRIAGDTELADEGFIACHAQGSDNAAFFSCQLNTEGQILRHSEEGKKLPSIELPARPRSCLTC